VRRHAGGGGLHGAALYSPVWIQFSQGARRFRRPLVSFVLLTVWRAPPLAAVALSAVGGVALGVMR
jgi:chromate transporter